MPDDGVRRGNDSGGNTYWSRWHDSLPGVSKVALPRSASWVSLISRSEEESLGSPFQIGMDAGTSGIRVSSFEEDTGRIRLFDFGPNEAGGTRFSFPAVCGLSGDTVVFGNDAIYLPAKHRFASSKAALLYPERARYDRERWVEAGLPASDVFKELQGPGPATFFCTVLLARTLELATPTLIESASADEFCVYLTLALGAPGRTSSPAHRRFRHALEAAVRLAGGIGGKPSFRPLLEGFAHAWNVASAHLEVPVNEARARIIPEVQAAARAIEGQLIPGAKFLLADIGSTTTEIAVLHREQR